MNQIQNKLGLVRKKTLLHGKDNSVENEKQKRHNNNKAHEFEHRPH